MLDYRSLLKGMPLSIGRSMASLLVILAVYLILGRQFVPALELFGPQIQASLKEQFDVPLTFERLEGIWTGPAPAVVIYDVRLGETLSLGRVEVVPALLSSIVEGRFVTSYVRISDIHVQLTAPDTQSDEFWSAFTVKKAADDSSDNNSTDDNIADNLPADDGSLATSAAQIGLSQLFEQLSPLLIQDRIIVQDLHVDVEFANARDIELQVDYLELKSEFSLKKLSATGRLISQDQESELDLVAEVSNWQTQADGQVYLSQSSFDWSPWSVLVPLPMNLSRFQSDIEVWLNLEEGRFQSLNSRIDLSELTFTGGGRELALKDFYTELSIDFLQPGLTAWLNNTQFRLGDSAWDSSVHQFSWQGKRMEVVSDRLDVGLISRLGVLMTENQALASLSPQGVLTNSSILWDPSLDTAERLQIKGRFQNVRVSPWQGVPGLIGLNGHLDMTSQQGFIRLTPGSTRLRLPSLLDQPVDIVRAAGDLQWQWSADNGLFLDGTGLEARVQGIDNLNLSFSVFAPPRPVWDVREPRLELMMSFDEANEQFMPLFVPLTIDRGTRQWILDNISRVNVSNAIMALSVPTIPKEDVALSFLLAMDINDGRMGFQKGWPEITGVDGRLEIGDGQLKVTMDRANFMGIDTENGLVQLPLQSGSKLRVSGKASGTAQQAVQVLTSTPLRDFVGEELDHWYLPDGTVNAVLDLAIPLSAEPVGGNIRLDLQGVDLMMPDYELGITDLIGQINWSDTRGLSGPAMTGRFFGHPAALTLSSDAAMNKLELVGSGKVDITDIGYWLDDGLLMSMSGETDFGAQLTITPDKTFIDIRSDLVGIPVDYSYPMNKSASDSWPTRLDLVFDQQDQMRLSADINRRIFAEFLFEDNKIDRGLITSEPQSDLPDEEGIYLNLTLDRFDGDAWQLHIEDLIALYDSYEPRLASDAPPVDEQLKEMTLNTSRLLFFEEPWSRVQVNGARTKEGWFAEYSASEVQGTLGWGHEDDAPLIVDIDYLTLVTEESEEDEDTDPLADVDLAAIPESIIQIRRLQLDKQDLGGWNLTVKPVENGILIDPLTANVTGVGASGSVLWQKSGESFMTEVDLRLNTGDVGTVLTAWDLSKDIRSESGVVDIALKWPGSPLGFKLDTLEGQINLDLKNGALLNLDQEYESLKLLSIFNFSLIVRRLAFDFKDIVRGGIGFDSVKSELTFKDGVMTMTKPLVVDGTSSKIQMGGSYNTSEDKLDFEMVFTLPISPALPFAALIAGLSPQVAVAVFVTERIMNDELSRMTSVKYEIKGSSEKPTYRLQKAFENDLSPDKAK